MQKRLMFNYKRVYALLVILFVFQPPLQAIWGPFKLWDEFFAFLIVPLFFMILYENSYIVTFERLTIILVALLFLFTLIGFAGTVKNGFQPGRVVLLDWYLHMKFFCGISVAYILFRRKDIDEVYYSFWNTLRGIILFIFLVDILDIVFHIFPTTYRLGLRAEGIFYGHPTNLAAVGFFLLALLFRMYEYVGNRILPYFCMIGFVIFTTMRAKAWGGLVFAIFLYLIVIRQRRNFGIATWLFCLAGAMLVAVKQLQSYYLMDSLKEVRSILTKLGLRVAIDYFPFGTGFATIGSAYSGDPYSPVYYLYHVDRVWGMTPEDPKFISDTFWPMIMGQTGFFGMLVYLILIFTLFLKIQQLKNYNAYAYASVLAAFVYLLISSTSESSFVNPMSIPLSLVIGIAFAELKNKREGYSDLEMRR